MKIIVLPITSALYDSYRKYEDKRVDLYSPPMKLGESSMSLLIEAYKIANDLGTATPTREQPDIVGKFTISTNDLDIIRSDYIRYQGLVSKFNPITSAPITEVLSFIPAAIHLHYKIREGLTFPTQFPIGIHS